MKYGVYVTYTEVFETNSAKEAWETLYQIYREDPLRNVYILKMEDNHVLESTNLGGSLVGHGRMLRTIWTHEEPEVARLDRLERFYDKITGGKDIIDAGPQVLRYVFGIK